MKHTNKGLIRMRQEIIYSESDLLGQVREVLEKKDVKTAEIYDANKGDLHYTSETLRKKFNLAFPQIVVKSGLYDLNNHLKYIPKEIIYEQLNQEFERIGSTRKSIYNSKRNKSRFPYSDTLKIRLNQSWPEILLCCNQLSEVKKYDEISKELLKDEYKMISKKLGRAATIRELTDWTVFSFDIYRQYFSTMKILKEECGFRHDYKGGKKPIELSMCKEELVRLYKKYNRRLTYNELKEESQISISTLFRRFETTKINVIWNQIERNMFDTTNI
ncbi:MULTISPECIES: hypothetical protein [Bacillus]|uniref:Uncharacterized protein n=1 Tax=Bacillus mycoides TaxID=1405 RepID=A0AAP7W4G6_BACMY|nr:MULTISPECIES: hypothetical protein [Bacillus]EJR97986.1 hypothetical protein IKM_05088 [Bacillus mycoides]KIV72562.1 hypothetical protein SZ39_2575 [Bacillus mycoides]MCD4647259.1 hypothetical protein [Bacillus mycoides]MDR4904350.1 hypothetical protein [Bacillus mycoides]MED0943315.1 hypothetical protein [Bacillus mycoides]